MIKVELSDTETRYLLALLGKDIGWHIKYKNKDKEKMARDVYGKVKKANETLRSKD